MILIQKDNNIVMEIRTNLLLWDLLIIGPKLKDTIPRTYSCVYKIWNHTQNMRFYCKLTTNLDEALWLKLRLKPSLMVIESNLHNIALKV